MLFSNKCIICRKLSDLTTKKTAAVFIAWKNECATAICHVLFGKNIDSVVSYLQQANYCSGCEQLVRDVSYAWRQIQSFKHQISDLSTKMYTLIDLNYQMIEEKSQPEITQERISFLLNAAVPMQIPDYSYEEMVEIIYSVVASSKKADLEAFVFTDTSLSNNVDMNTNFVRIGSYEVNPDYFNVVNKVKEECSDLEQEAVDDSIFNEDADEKPQIKSEHCDSNSDDFYESENGSDFANHEDLGLNKYVDDGSNSSSEFEVKEKKRKRGRPPLTPSQKLEREMAKQKNRKPRRTPLTLSQKLNKKKQLSKLYWCDEEGCGKKFICEANKQIHIRQMHKGESKPYKCTECEQKFTSMNHLHRHMNKVHEEGRVLKTNNCKFCGTKYIELNDLTSHYSTSHKKHNPFLCAFCPEFFQNSLDLTKHTKQFHRQPNVCKVCDAVFITPSLLSSHEIKRHVGRAEWPQCSVCGQKCECQARLKVHMKSHEQSTMFKCDICQLEFKSPFQLKSHSELHIEGKFTCKVCRIVLPTRYDVKAHEMTHNAKETVERRSDKSKQLVKKKKIRPINYNVECKFCGKGYFKEEDLNEHYTLSHLGPNPFTCAFCPHISSNSADLIGHMKSVHPIHMKTHEQLPLLKCEVCQLEFKSSSKLQSHSDLHIEGVFTCKVCGTIMPNLYDLKVHESEVHDSHEPIQTVQSESEESNQPVEKKKPGRRLKWKVRPIKYNFECKFCGKGYFKEEELNEHYAVAHLGLNPFTCAFCPLICSNSVDLSKHMKSVHPDPNSLIGKLKCDSCPRYFSNIQSLSVHKKTHLDPSLLYKCPLCSAVFTQRYYLRSHMETHSEERKYVCDKCGKAYKTSTNLYTHSIRHDEQQRKFPCKICGKKFFTKAYCKTHERCHTNMKEFICHVCGKSFNHDFNLREHLKIHAGVPTRRRNKLKLKSAETDPKLL